MCCGLVVRHSEVERTEEVDVARIAWVGGHQGALHEPDNRRTMVGGGKIGSTEVAKVRNPHGQAQGRQPFLCIRQRSASRLDFSVLEENAGLEPPAWNSQKSLQNCQHSGSERDGLRAEMSRGNTQHLHQRVPHRGLRAAPGIGRGIKRGIDGIGFQQICKELRDLRVHRFHVLAEQRAEAQRLGREAAVPRLPLVTLARLLRQMHGKGMAQMLRLGFRVPARLVQVDKVRHFLRLRVVVIEGLENACSLRIELVDTPLPSAKVLEKGGRSTVHGVVVETLT